MEDKVVVQKIRKEYGTKMEIALKYYHIISILNNLALTERQIELIAHTAVRGNISSATSKDEFIRIYGSSRPTINNMISKLAKMGLLVKNAGKITVNQLIKLDFSKGNYLFQISLITKNADKQVDTDNHQEDLSSSEDA